MAKPQPHFWLIWAHIQQRQQASLLYGSLSQHIKPATIGCIGQNRSCYQLQFSPTANLSLETTIIVTSLGNLSTGKKHKTNHLCRHVRGSRYQTARRATPFPCGRADKGTVLKEGFTKGGSSVILQERKIERNSDEPQGDSKPIEP